jgi:hypothetical protein
VQAPRQSLIQNKKCETQRICGSSITWRASARGWQIAKPEGFRKLDKLRLTVEKVLEPEADFEAVVRHEREISKSVGGRIVTAKSSQLPLFRA